MKPIHTLLCLLLTLLLQPFAAQAHPGHGDGLLSDGQPAHLLMHPWQLFAALVVGALLAALSRAPWMRWTGGAIAAGALAFMFVGSL